jgi:FKBP-type peptidyl-prolyl cis-trans isomerase FkpA
MLNHKKYIMRAINLFVILFLAGFIISCSPDAGFQEHESGLKYKYIIHNEEAEKPAVGDILVMSMSYSTMKDSIIEASDHYRMQLNEPSHSGGSIEDAMSLLYVGDSARFIIDAYHFYVKTRKIELPKFLNPGDKLYFDLKLKDFLKFEEFEQERNTIISHNEADEDNLLQKYLKRINNKIEPTTSGLYYIPIKEGNGPKAEPGRRVYVHYYGYFIDGKPFDNSYERGEPIDFVLGVGQVIQGWDEGISMMKIGEKAKLIIPSYLGYGSQQRGDIPPFSTLIFEVELVDVQ